MTSGDSAGTAPGGFEREVGEFLLVAFAAGEDVEGEWRLMDTDPMVPDVSVTVTRIDCGPSVPAADEDATFAPGDPEDFKTRLQSFVLERFADGEDIEGSWVVRFAREPLPDWEVTIVTSGDLDVVRTGDGITSSE